MQRKHLVAAVVAAAALAAVVTWQLRRHPDKGVPAQPHGTAPHVADPHLEHGHGHGDRETPIDEPELRSGPPRVLVSDEPVGPAKLVGRVVDASGQPVAGAVVTAAAQPVRSASSGADGAFAIDGLMERPYVVAVRAPSGVAGPLRMAASADKAATPTTVALRPGGKVSIEVVDERQQPMRGVTVELRGLEVRTLEGVDEQVVVESVVPGAYVVAAWAPGYAREFLPAVVGSGATSLRVELVRGAEVAGRVVDEAGQPVAGARVRYEAANDAIPGSDLLRDSVVSDAAGKFSFAALPTGSFRLMATHATLALGSSELLSIDATKPKTDAEIVLPAGATVRGTVVGADGKPAAFARVRVGLVIPGSRIVVPPHQIVADAAGAFAVSGLQRRQLSAVAVHPAAASAAVAVDTRGGDVSGVTLKLDSVGTLAGQVVDSDGKPVAGAQISAFPSAADRRGVGAASADAGAAGAGGELGQWQLRGFPQQVTDVDGGFSLTGLPAGEYRLRASRGASVGGWNGASVDLVARAGDPAVRLALPAEGSVKGKVTFPDGTTPEQITVALGMAQRALGGGELLLESLAPQSYQLVLRGPTFRPRVIDVKVEAGKTTDLGTVVVTPRAEPAAKPR